MVDRESTVTSQMVKGVIPVTGSITKISISKGIATVRIQQKLKEGITSYQTYSNTNRGDYSW